MTEGQLLDAIRVAIKAAHQPNMENPGLTSSEFAMAVFGVDNQNSRKKIQRILKPLILDGQWVHNRKYIPDAAGVAHPISAYRPVWRETT